MKRREIPGDDGRVIASMNVEGMRGYRPPAPPKAEPPEAAAEQPGLSGRETFWMILGAMRAAVLLFAVFAVAIVAFVAAVSWLAG